MENLTKKLARCLSVGIGQHDVRVQSLQHVLKACMILTAGVLFCLTFQGCDGEQGASIGIAQSQGEASSALPSQDHVEPSHQQEPFKNSALPRIVAFGDSLTAGLGVAPDEAYPEQLARWLHGQGYTYEVINAGVSGDTTAGGLRRVAWILKNEPSLVILELGANDGLRGQPLIETYNNLSAIIKRLQANGVIVVLAGMQLPLTMGTTIHKGFQKCLYDSPNSMILL